VVEGAEGRQPVRDDVRLDRARRLHIGFWVAQQILDGQEVPKDLVVPFLRIDQANLEQSLGPPKRAASPTWNTRWKMPRR
jgi:hypothetical protein